MKRLPWGLLVLALVVAIAAGACGGDSDEAGDTSAAGGSSGDGFDAPAARERVIEGDAGDYGSTAEETTASGDADAAVAPADRSTMPLPQSGPNVIKTADIELEVERDSFQEAFQRVVDAARKRAGFVLSSRVGGEKARRGTITIRVPSQTFEGTVGEIKELGTVTNERESGQDVTEEFIDLQARIRHLSSQEAVMLGLMNSAQTIPDTIRIQNELTGIQLQIERLRGRLRFLEDQTSLSTITVTLTEVGAAPAAAEEDPSSLQQAWQVLRDTTGAIASAFLIGGAAAVPVLVVLLLGFLIFRWVRPRVSRVTGS